jgi:hypothetical protein
LGLATYHIVVRSVLPVAHCHPVVEGMLNDTLLVGTLLVVVRVLEEGSMTDNGWISTVLGAFVGVAVYHGVLSHVMRTDSVSRLSDRLKKSLEDVLKYGTIFAGIHYGPYVYQQITGDELGLSAEREGKALLYVVLGFLAYHAVSAVVDVVVGKKSKKSETTESTEEQTTDGDKHSMWNINLPKLEMPSMPSMPSLSSLIPSSVGASLGLTQEQEQEQELHLEVPDLSNVHLPDLSNVHLPDVHSLMQTSDGEVSGMDDEYSYATIH